jgi:hypothetical protein
MKKDMKRELREEKRLLKKDGNRSRRRYLQRQLELDPEVAHKVEFEFNEFNTSTQMNGFDNDSTRKTEVDS